MTEDEFRRQFDQDRQLHRPTHVTDGECAGVAMMLKGSVIMLMNGDEIGLSDAYFLGGLRTIMIDRFRRQVGEAAARESTTFLVERCFD